MELTFEAGTWWAYVLVFLVAATPVLEVLVVVPVGVLAGMPPAMTAIVAAAGNVTTVVVVAVVGDRLLAWWRKRRPVPDDRQTGGRAGRARDIARRWGLPGLALLAPLTTGTHIATLAALAIDRDTRRVLRWMSAGILVWAGVAAAVTAAGLEVFT